MGVCMLSTADLYGGARAAADFRSELSSRLLGLVEHKAISQAEVATLLNDCLAQTDPFTLFWLQGAVLFVGSYEDALGLEHPSLVVQFADAEAALHFACLQEVPEAIARTFNGALGGHHLTVSGGGLQLHGVWQDGHLELVGEP